MKPLVVVAACCLALALAGCGGDADDLVADPAATSSLPTAPTLPTEAATDLPTTAPVVLPDCAEVWVADATLPRRYRGCALHGADVLPEPIMCAYGLTIVTHAHRFYATPGRVINDVGNLKTSDKYQRALASCQG